MVWCSTLAKTVKLGVSRGGGKGSKVMLRVLRLRMVMGQPFPTARGAGWEKGEQPDTGVGRPGHGFRPWH